MAIRLLSSGSRTTTRKSTGAPRGRRNFSAQRPGRTRLRRAGLARGDRIELLRDFSELPPQGLDPLDLVLGGSPLPAVQGAVDAVQVLPEPLLARDRAALLVRDDLLLDRVELVDGRLNGRASGIRFGQRLLTRDRRGPSGVDLVD